MSWGFEVFGSNLSLVLMTYHVDCFLMLANITLIMELNYFGESSSSLKAYSSYFLEDVVQIFLSVLLHKHTSQFKLYKKRRRLGGLVTG